MSRRTAVTGVGCVTVSGDGRAALGRSLSGGRSEVLLEGRDSDNWRVEGPVPDFGGAIPKLKLRRLDHTMLRALRASREAVEQAGLTIADAPLRTGTVTGTGYAGCGTSLEFIRTHWREGPEFADPARFPNTVPNGPMGQISIFLGTRGPCTNFFDTGNAGECALEYAQRVILSGYADSMIVCGVDERSEPVVVMERAYRRVERVSEPSGLLRPFDVSRTGTAMGGASATVLLEDEEAARARGADPLAILGPLVQTAEPTAPGRPPSHSDLLVEVAHRALDAAGIGPDDVAFVNSSARGSGPMDALEIDVIREVFGPRAAVVPVTAPYAYTGDLTAGGVLRILASVHALETGRVPAVARTRQPEPGIRLATGDEELATPHVLHIGTGMGGCHTAFVVTGVGSTGVGEQQ